MHVKRIDEMNVNENWINKLLDIGMDNGQIIRTIRKAIEELKTINKQAYGNLDPYSIKYDKEKQVIYYDGDSWNTSLGSNVILKNVPYKNLSKSEIKDLTKRLEKSWFWIHFKKSCEDHKVRQEEIKRWEDEEKKNPVLKYADHADDKGWKLMKEGGIKKGDRFWYIKTMDITKFKTGNVDAYYFSNEAGALWAAEMFKCGYGAIRSDTMV